MKLVVDANILVAKLTRAKGRALITGAGLELFIAEKPWEEARYELAKRYRAIAERTGASPEHAAEQHTLAVRLAEASAQVVAQPLYADLEREARRRIPRGPDDWPTVALALRLGAAIWTQDGDFLGCGVPTWTTDTLRAQLERP